MRINLNPQPQQIAESSRTGAQSTAPASSSISGNSALAPDQAQLSPAHAQVHALAAQVAQLPEVRQERVVALRQILQSGNYRLSADQTAQAIFVHMIAGSAA